MTSSKAYPSNPPSETTVVSEELKTADSGFKLLGNSHQGSERWAFTLQVTTIEACVLLSPAKTVDWWSGLNYIAFFKKPYILRYNEAIFGLHINDC